MARIVIDSDLRITKHFEDGEVESMGKAEWRGIAERTGAKPEVAWREVYHQVLRWLFTEEMDILRDVVIAPDGTVFQTFCWRNDDRPAPPPVDPEVVNMPRGAMA